MQSRICILLKTFLCFFPLSRAHTNTASIWMVTQIVQLASKLLRHSRRKYVVRRVCVRVRASDCVKCIFASCRLAGWSRQRFHYRSVAFICSSREKSLHLKWMRHSPTCIHKDTQMHNWKYGWTGTQSVWQEFKWISPQCTVATSRLESQAVWGTISSDHGRYCIRFNS